MNFNLSLEKIRLYLGTYRLQIKEITVHQEHFAWSRFIEAYLKRSVTTIRRPCKLQNLSYSKSRTALYSSCMCDIIFKLDPVRRNLTPFFIPTNVLKDALTFCATWKKRKIVLSSKLLSCENLLAPLYHIVEVSHLRFSFQTSVIEINTGFDRWNIGSKPKT